MTVQSVVDQYLQAVDAAVPGMVEGLYLVGSVALGDFRPHRSDIDFVALTAEPLDAASLSALERVHARLGKQRPVFDGIYVTRAGLTSNPTSLDGCSVAHEGMLLPAGQGDMIAWHTLAQHGLCCRGPAVKSLGVWTDAQALAAWTDHNLDAYWQRLLDRSSRPLSRAGMVGLGAWYCEWCVTGVSRLHYTLATGRITSKHEAARYAQATFPRRWSRVIREAVSIRRDDGRRSLYRLKMHRRRDVHAFMRMAIADAHRIYRLRSPGLVLPS